MTNEYETPLEENNRSKVENHHVGNDSMMVFTDEGTLFVVGYMQEQMVNRILIDEGSTVKILPLRTLKDLGMSTEELGNSLLMIQGFNQGGERALGIIRPCLVMINLDDAERAALDKPLAFSSLLSLQNTILEYRQRLADQLAESTCQASTTGPELRSAAETLTGLVERVVIAGPAASGCLRAVAECVHVCLGHCALLEYRGLALCPTLLRVFRPFMDQALAAGLKKIDMCTAAVAVLDDWVLSFPAVGSVVATQHKLSSSAHRFTSMVQELCEDIGSLDIMQLSEHALEGVLQSFGSYVSTMINAFSASFEIENLEGSGRKIVKLAETETQQIALLANALSLADELLPRAAIKLSSFARNDEKGLKQRELKRRLQRLVEQLRDSFCRQHALDISYSLKMVGFV
ncbi:exocyst complex component 84B [Striga asiatica]|uniref:Exocyst complex component 84B n=1 Tax=Striga asiatica TaxID=4170 RepID=A0A5A7R9N6_STRAF|nr:exocyst complex component 84B [Striga asiatica]